MTDCRTSSIEPVHEWFELTYSNYLVLPRTLLQSMPVDWQQRMVASLDELRAAFEHIPQAEGYKVEAATSHEVSDLDGPQLAQLGITEDWYRGETPPDGLDADMLKEWEAAHEDPDGPVYYRDGQEVAGDEWVQLPAADPVPHYNRGRTYIQPAATERASGFEDAETLREQVRQLEALYNDAMDRLGQAANRQDVARQTTGQHDTEPAYSVDICPGFPDQCPNIRTVPADPPTHSGGIRCGCADTTPAVNPACRNCKDAPAVGQPAEAHDTEARPPRSTWRVEGHDVDRWLPLGLAEEDHETAVARHADWDQCLPDTPTRLVREDTTWTVENETR